MIDFLFDVLRTLPIISALLLIASIKIKRERRAEQLFMPIVAVVYLVVALVLLYRFNGLLYDALRGISEVTPINPGLPGSESLYLWQNLLLLLIFAALKGILVLVAKVTARRWHDLLVRASQSIYEYSEENVVWFVRREMGNLRRYWQALYWTSVVITVFFLALVFTFPNWPGFFGIAFPALAVLVIGEFFFAIDGMTKQEFGRDIAGEQDRALRVSNYGPLRRVLRDIFPGRVLSDDVHLSSRAALDSGYRVGELARSADEEERLVGSYFSRVRSSQMDVDTNLVEAALQLMKHRSVLINNPFYVDLTPYVSVPCYHSLLRSRKVLIVPGRDSLVPDLVEWIDKGLEDVTGIPHLWNVAVLTDQRPANVHVGVLPFADVHNLDLMRSNEDFLREVDLVVLAEPSRMIATGQLGISLLVSKCGQEARPAFLAFDGNHDGLVDALSHLLKTDFTEVVASGLPQGASNEVVWNADGPHMHTEIFPRISRYLGMGTEIGAVAVKYQVPRFHWVGGDAFPVEDMQWIAEQYYAQINRFADIDLSQDALDEAFVPISNPWDLAQADNYFLIVEDEISNVFETVRKYSTRAKSSGFVNLISENYLLRDYMVDNRELFSADPKAIPPIVADFARTERNLALRMVMALAWSEVSERDLEREFELSGQLTSVPNSVAPNSYFHEQEPATVTALRQLIVEHTNAVDLSIRQLTGFEMGEKQDRDQAYFRMDVGADLTPVIQALSPAYFYVEDEQGRINRIGSLLFDHVYQALLPGQFVTYAGKYYEVQSISSDDVRSGVVLRRAADHIRDRRVYRQWRDFTVHDLVDQGFVGSRTDRGGIRIRKALASIDVDSHGYFELTSRAEMGSARPVRLEHIPRRKYDNKSILEIEFPDIPDSARKTITLLLNEMFLTVFPHAHPYVVALTDDSEEEFGQLLTSLYGDVNPRSIYIAEDSMVDLGLIVAVERNWDRFMEMITDYLTWLTTPRKTEPETAKERADEFVVEFPEVPVELQPKSWWRRMIAKIMGIFRRDGKVNSEGPETVTEAAPPRSHEEVEIGLGEGGNEVPGGEGGPSDTDHDTENSDVTAASAPDLAEESDTSTEHSVNIDEPPGDDDELLHDIPDGEAAEEPGNTTFPESDDEAETAPSPQTDEEHRDA